MTKTKDNDKKMQSHFFSEAVLFDPKLQAIRRRAMNAIEYEENLETPEGRNRIFKAIRQILASYGFDGSEWKKSSFWSR